MSTPQDSRARRREKKRRALKDKAWTLAQQNQDSIADKPQAKAKKAT